MEISETLGIIRVQGAGHDESRGNEEVAAEAIKVGPDCSDAEGASTAGVPQRPRARTKRGRRCGRQSRDERSHRMAHKGVRGVSYRIRILMYLDVSCMYPACILKDTCIPYVS